MSGAPASVVAVCRLQMADPASNPYSKANYTPTGAGDPGRVAKLELLVVELREQIVARKARSHLGRQSTH